MRKKTAPRTQKQNQASPCELSGLIAQAKTPRQSAEGNCVLDNRYHRTSNEGWVGACAPTRRGNRTRRWSRIVGPRHMAPAQRLVHLSMLGLSGGSSRLKSLGRAGATSLI